MFVAMTLVAAVMVVNHYQPRAAWVMALWPALLIAFWFLAALVTVPLWLVCGWRQATTFLGRLRLGLLTPFAILAGRAPSWAGAGPLLVSAVAFSGLLAGAWFAWRLLAALTASSIAGEMYSHQNWGYWQAHWDDLFRHPPDFMGIAATMAWSLSRWWLLFGVITIAGGVTRGRDIVPVAPGETLAARFLAFVPWFAALEFGDLVGAWVWDPRDFFPVGLTGSLGLFQPNESYGVNLVGWTNAARGYWLLRTAVPTFLVGLVYFRRVLGFRGPWRMALAAALVPAALSVSVIWSWLFYVYYLDDAVRLGR